MADWIGVDMSEVTWCQHPVYTHYEGSSDGRIRSLDRITTDSIGRRRLHLGREMKLRLQEPYYRVMLLMEGVSTTVTAHAFICETFHGLKPSPNLVVRHLNGDSLDNRPDNLKWGTPAENIQDTIRHGNNRNLSKTHCKRNHEFTPENTYTPTGTSGRSCKKCRALRAREWRARELRAKASV